MTEKQKWRVTARAGKRIEGKPVAAGDVLEMSKRKAQAYFNTGQLVPDKGERAAEPEPKPAPKAAPKSRTRSPKKSTASHDGN